MNGVSRQVIVGWFLVYILCCASAFALEPNEILVIANSDFDTSVRLAQYYCAKRAVPTGNILALPLGKVLRYDISRDDYEKYLAKPIRAKLSTREFAGRIKCLLTTYGVPLRVGKRGQLKDKQLELSQLEKRRQQVKESLQQLQQSGTANTSGRKKYLEQELTGLQFEIDNIVGNQTDASVDSELSMVLFDNYELFLWQPNKLKRRRTVFQFRNAYGFPS